MFRIGQIPVGIVAIASASAFMAIGLTQPRSEPKAEKPVPTEPKSIVVEKEKVPAPKLEVTFTGPDEIGSANLATFTATVTNTGDLTMEVIDSVDPVKSGDEVVYEVKVRNTGTSADKNLKLACKLPPGMTLVEASGPVEYPERIGSDFKLIKSQVTNLIISVQDTKQNEFDSNGFSPGSPYILVHAYEYPEQIELNPNKPVSYPTVSIVDFYPVEFLPAQSDVTFKVKVKTDVAGTYKFKATISSDHLITPVTKEESTTVYGK